MNKKSVQKGKKASDSNNRGQQNNSSFFPVKREVMGIGMTDALEEKILESVINFIKKTTKTAYIVTPNPEMVVVAKKNTAFKNALNSADLALCDGIGLLWASKIVGKPLTHRIIGTNFVERVCEKVANQPITVGFLGGRPGVAVKAAECLRQKYPNLNVVFAGSEWSTVQAGKKEVSSISYKVFSIEKGNSAFIQNTKYQIPNTIDILFVAFGAPKQELWMYEHVGKIPVRVMMGVGGAFDQIVDPSLRAPIYINSIGMGWLYRLIRQPWRIKRQVSLILFVFLTFQAYLKHRRTN